MLRIIPKMNNMSRLVEIAQVDKFYSGHQALKKVSFDIPKGSIFGLLGPNGSGKTSLIRILTGITAPDNGYCTYNNVPIMPGFSRSMGYLPEERGMYKKMKVGEQLIYFARLKGLSKKEAKAKVDFWLEKLGLTDWKNKEVENLSKGMQQKIQFIAALIHDPDFLILDEPFSGFDPINAELIKNEILELAKKGVTIMLSTHNMNSVEELCTDMALLNKGELILYGNVKEVKRRFFSGTWRISFKGNWVNFSNALWTSAKIVEKKTEGDIHTALLELLPGNNLHTILHSLMPAVEIVALEENIPSMHQIFVKAVGGDAALVSNDLTE